MNFESLIPLASIAALVLIVLILKGFPFKFTKDKNGTWIFETSPRFCPLNSPRRSQKKK